eukprot:4137812-Pyramimonas_sp.AAC.1
MALDVTSVKQLRKPYRLDVALRPSVHDFVPFAGRWRCKQCRDIIPRSKLLRVASAQCRESALAPPLGSETTLGLPAEYGESFEAISGE